jgi:hypothetical protein
VNNLYTGKNDGIERLLEWSYPFCGEKMGMKKAVIHNLSTICGYNYVN